MSAPKVHKLRSAYLAEWVLSNSAKLTRWANMLTTASDGIESIGLVSNRIETVTAEIKALLTSAPPCKEVGEDMVSRAKEWLRVHGMYIGWTDHLAAEFTAIRREAPAPSPSSVATGPIPSRPENGLPEVVREWNERDGFAHDEIADVTWPVIRDWTKRGDRMAAELVSAGESQDALAREITALREEAETAAAELTRMAGEIERLTSLDRR